MKISYLFVWVVYLGMGAGGLTAAPLTQAEVTQFKGNVTLSKAGGAPTPVTLNEKMTPSDSLRTGISSLAEVIFNDKTISRLGANTILAFSDQKREFDIQQGTALLQVPKGQGVSRIQVGAVTAAITGTTVFVQKNASGIVRLIVVEGSVTASLPGNKHVQKLTAGQMLLLPPGVQVLPNPVTINIATLLSTSKLVRSFDGGLLNQEQVDATMSDQKELLEDGGFTTSGVVITSPDDLRILASTGLDATTFDSLTLREEEDGEHHYPVPPTSKVNLELDASSSFTPTQGDLAGDVFTSVNGVVDAIDPATYGYPAGSTVFEVNTIKASGGVGSFIAMPDPDSFFILLAFGTGFAPGQASISLQNLSSQVIGHPNISLIQILAIQGDIEVGNSSIKFDSSLLASTGMGDININSNSNLTFHNPGQIGVLSSARNINIDSSTIDISAMTPSSQAAAIELLAQGNINLNQATLAGNQGSNGLVNLTTSAGDINVSRSFLGGTGVSSVIIDAGGNKSISMNNATLKATDLVSLRGNHITLTNVGIIVANPGGSILFKTNGYTNGGGNTFTKGGIGATPTIQPY
jgi:hypothetical protein